MLHTRILAAATATVLALGMSVGGAGAALALVPPPIDVDTQSPRVSDVCVPQDAVPEVLEESRTEYQRYSWTGGPIDVAPTEMPPSANWTANTSNYQGAGGGSDPIGVAFQRDNPGQGNADWFFWTATKVIDQPYVPGVPAVTCPDPEPTVNYEVGLYLYKKLDPSAPASWPNSGPQRLIDVTTGTAWFTEFPGSLPSDVCGPGWAVQQDKVSYTGSFTWPSSISYPDDTIGWPPIYAAQHNDLSTANYPNIVVPDCEPPTLPTINVVGSLVPFTCERPSGSFTVGLGVGEENGDKLVWSTSALGDSTLPGTVPVTSPGVVTVTVDVSDEFPGYGLNVEGGPGVADPQTGAVTFTFVFAAAADCPVVVPEIEFADLCITGIEVDAFTAFAPSAAPLTPIASFTVITSPNVSYSYTIDGGAPIAIVFPEGDDRVPVDVPPGSTVVVSATAASGFTLPAGYEPWEKTFSESGACFDLPPLANWPASVSASNQVCERLGLVSGVITVQLSTGPLENPNPVRYYIAYGSPQQQELTASVTQVAPGSYVVTAVATDPGDSINDAGNTAAFTVSVGGDANQACGELPTLAFTGSSDITNWLGVVAVLLTVAGMGFVARRHRVEV